MEKYKKILNQISKFEEKLKDPSLSLLDRQLLEIKIGELCDTARRMTFHISCVEEDNYI